MLIRPELKYHSSGHPVLSRGQIDAYAVDFLRRYFPERLRTPGQLAPASLLELANSEDGVLTQNADLGHDQWRKRLGRMYLNRKLILLDNCLFSERQISLPFVTAHELAHWLLHRDCNISAIKEREQFPDDDEGTEGNNVPEAPTWSSFDRIEWQASKLAAALLIPKSAGINSIWAIQSDCGIVTRKGIIYENTGAAGRAESLAQLKHVADVFGVSQTVTRIRLKDLGLYHQQSDERTGCAVNAVSLFGQLNGRILSRNSATTD